jgi:hypothetical protein
MLRHQDKLTWIFAKFFTATKKEIKSFCSNKERKKENVFVATKKERKKERKRFWINKERKTEKGFVTAKKGGRK